MAAVQESKLIQLAQNIGNHIHPIVGQGMAMTTQAVAPELLGAPYDPEMPREMYWVPTVLEIGLPALGAAVSSAIEANPWTGVMLGYAAARALILFTHRANNHTSPGDNMDA